MRFLSLFSGIEAAGTAWKVLGWELAAVAEIESFQNKVTEFRHNTPRNLGDVAKITDDDIASLGQLDLVVGGSPCQDLSAAGRRAGLVGERSNLFYEQVRIFHAARALCGARWLLWENVPGAFTTHRGRDFAAVVGALAGAELGVPRDGWKNTGVALGPQGLVEWCVLDAQWFGVPQRRRRVYALLDTGNWADRGPILFDAESLCGNHPSRGQAREAAAGSPTDGAGEAGGEVVGPLTSRFTPNGHGAAGLNEQDVKSGHLISGAVSSKWVKGTGGPAGDECYNLVAFSCKDSGGDTQDEMAPTLRSMNFDASHANAGGQLAVAYDPIPFDTTQVTSALNYSRPAPGDPCHPLASTAHAPAIAGAVVRRLTPRECERLQGFPDDYTLVPIGKRMSADGPRYRALGNSMAVPVMGWIGRRIEEVT